MSESLLAVSVGHGMEVDFPRSFAADQAALRHAERTADEALIGVALGALARGSDRIDEALPYVRAAVERLRDAGSLERVAGLLSR